jgi:tRNA(Ile)-lysidine synthase
LKYAEKNALEWREDASNANTKYLRNNIRHQIIPKLKELHPSFLSNFKHSIAYLDQTNALAKQEIRTWKNKQFIADGNQFKISISSLKQCNPLKAYLYGLFKDYGFREWNNVKDLLEGMSGKFVVSKTHRLLKDREYLLLSEINETTGNSLSYTIEKTHKVLVKPLSIVFSKVTQRAENSEHIIYVDENALKYPLVIRKWNKGDYFYPIGLHGKKKLAKFFKDEKVSLLDKEAQWLLCSEGKIVWVIGRRADNRFKVVDTTTEIMKIAIRV